MLPLMRPIPRIDINELRNIADRKWDALTAIDCSARETDRYDSFLATGAVMLWNGASDVEVGDYFVDVEIEYLGLDSGGGIRERAQLFARAIREYLDTLPERVD